MIVVKSFQEAKEMPKSPSNGTQMENLMRATPYVEEAGTKSLWNAQLHIILASIPDKCSECTTYCINYGPGDVAEAFDDEKPPTHLSVGLLNSKGLCRMCHWKRPGPSNGNE